MIVENRQSENIIVYEIEREDHGKTLKQVLKNKLSVSSRLLSKLKRSKNVFINEEHKKYYEVVREGDMVKIFMEEEPNQFLPQNIPFQVIYEDMDLILINKQPDIVTHPTKRYPDNTLANAAAWYLESKSLDCKIRFVNRLDMDTSGILVIAKNPYAHHILSEQMQNDKVIKKYTAFVWGVVENDYGRIDAPIYRVGQGTIKRIIDERGQESITEYKVLERYKEATMLEVHLLTGRTHQIRVHMEYIGYPMIGDPLYGRGDEDLITRQALHSTYISFFQPRYNNEIEVKAPLPEDLIKLKNYLKNM